MLAAEKDCFLIKKVALKVKVNSRYLYGE